MIHSNLLQLQNVELDNLKKINLVVGQGEIIAIVGKPTSGKNTLLKCLNLTLRPTKGSISFANKDLVILAKKELRETTKQIAYIEANPYFIETKTVFENMALLYQLENTAVSYDHKIQDLLRIVGLLGKQDSFPNELAPIQKVRLDIARSLTNNVKILLIEDLTNIGDSKGLKQLEQLICKLNKELGICFIINTNDPSFLKETCEHALIMENGEIIEKVKVKDLFFNPTSTTAKDYIKFITKAEIPLVIRNNLSNTKSTDNCALIRITMDSDTSFQETLYGTLDNMNLSLIIVQAYQDKIQNYTFNVILAKLNADNETITTFIHILKDNNIYSETIGYANTVL
jgi:D-methionine transport system ATP-binding protein